jgi:negative regulator of sigma E activity
MLKRSGAPYVLIASEALTEMPAAAYLPKRPVWIARDVLNGEHAVATQEALLDAVAAAVGDDAAVGVERAPERVSWEAALRAAGVRVRVVPAWLARVARLARQPVVYRSAGGKLVVRLGYEQIARALGALPSGQMA